MANTFRSSTAWKKAARSLHLSYEDEELIPLSGGVVSTILEIKNRDMVIKHTNSYEKGIVPAPFLPGDESRLLKYAPKTHNIDYLHLKALGDQLDNAYEVPAIVYYDKKNRVTIVKDYRCQKFELCQDLLIENRIPREFFSTLGRSVAKLTNDVSSLDIGGVEPPELQFQERLEEIFVNFGYQARYRDVVLNLYERCTNSKTVIPTDTHPKNTAYNLDSGRIMLFDFGRITCGDAQHVPATTIAHYLIPSLARLQPINTAIDSLKQFLSSYSTVSGDPDETYFPLYLVSEWLHRVGGPRWLDSRLVGDNIDGAKNAVFRITRFVFDAWVDNRPVATKSFIKELPLLMR